MANGFDSRSVGRQTGGHRFGETQFLTLVFLGLWAACSAAGQNLLPNPGFNTSISGWTPNYSGGISLSWSDRDAKGSSGSGSLQITNTSAVDNNGYNVFGICVAVTAGQSYHQGASFLLPGGQTRAGSFIMFTQFYSSADCSIGNVGSVASPVLSPWADTWQRLDTQPFVAPAGAIRAFALFGFRKIGDGGSLAGNVDEVVFESSGANLCYSSDDQLCLGTRFRVTTQWTDDAGSGSGHAVQLTSDTGTFWFFGPTNLEMLVKVLDACAFNGRKWVFEGGLTNVRVEATVMDLQTGTSNVYTNPLNTAFAPVQDTSAFSSCP